MTLRDLRELNKGTDFTEVRYEDLVAEPETQIRVICEFAGITDCDVILENTGKKVSAEYVGSWEEALSGNELEMISPIIQQQMSALGYTM